MKRFIAVVLAICFMIPIFKVIPVNAIEAVQPEGMVIKTKENINLDFDGDLPSEMTSSTSFITDYEGENVFKLNGRGSIVGTTAIGSSRDVLFEADVKLDSSSGASTGAFSISLRSAKGANTPTFRFAYIDVINYNPETKRAEGKNLIHDRLAIVLSSSDNASMWTYSTISPEEIGILDKIKHSTPWVKVKAIAVGEMLYFTMYDMDGKVLSSLKASTEEIAGSMAKSLTKSGGLRFSSHSCEVLYDNVKYNDVSLIKNIDFKTNTSTVEKGKPLKFSITGETMDGKNDSINVNDINFQYNVVDTQINTKNTTVTFSEIGEKTIAAETYDAYTGLAIKRNIVVDVVEKIDFENLEIELPSKYILKNTPISFQVLGISDKKEKFPINKDVRVEGVVADLENMTITSNIVGDNNISVYYEDLAASASVIVSQYEEISFKVANSIEQHQTNEYSVNVRKGEEWVNLSTAEYIITADNEGLLFENGKIIGRALGDFKVTVIIEGVETTVDINVYEKPFGVMLEDDFEDVSKASEYMPYSSENIVDDNGNKVYQIENKTSPLFGRLEWTDYTIEASVKLATPVIEENQKAATFEIIPHRTEGDLTGTVIGAQKGTSCVYRTKHRSESGSYMRITSVVGEHVDVEDGQWHKFKVTAMGTQIIFEIDDTVQYYNGLLSAGGYFSFLASNCKAYIDNIKVTKYKLVDKGKNAELLESIEPVVPEKSVNPYMPWLVSGVNTIKANYNDGSFAYISNDENLTIEIFSGQENALLVRKKAILFNRDVKDGARVGIKASYKGKECKFVVIAKLPGCSYENYVKTTIDQRRESYVYRLLFAYDKGLGTSIRGLGGLGPRMARMVMYPRLEDYSDYVSWYIEQAEYEDKVVGRGNDGGDFVILQSIAMYKELYGKTNVSNEAWGKLREYLVNYNYALPGDSMSENHRMIYFATALLTAEAWPEATMMNGWSSAETKDYFKQCFLNWANERISRGMGEYDSPHYYMVDLFGLELFYTYVKDEQLKQSAYDMITLIYSDILENALEDNFTGAHLRVYHTVATASRNKPINFLFNVSTYPIDENYGDVQVQEGQNVVSTYMPPQVLFDIGLDNKKRYVTKERHKIYTSVDDPLITESIRKYTYLTPEYSVGCKVYTDDLTKYRNPTTYALTAITQTWQRPVSVYAGHQEIAWTMQFGKGTDSIITENHPGPTGLANSGAHAYFQGDANCNCSEYFQEENVSMGMHKITHAGELEYTHFWIPKPRLERIDEEQGWIFVKHYDTYAAIKLLKDGKIEFGQKQYEWGPEIAWGAYKLKDVEIRINSKNTAFVSEMTSKSDFNGSFEQFKEAIINNEKNIKYSISDPYSLEYTGLNGKTIKLDCTNNKRFINGTAVNFDDYKLVDNPYVQAEWNGGLVQMKSRNASYTIRKTRLMYTSNLSQMIYEDANNLQTNIEYHSKIGDAVAYINHNTDTIIDVFSKIGQYEGSFVSAVFYKKMNVIAEIISDVYKNASKNDKIYIYKMSKTIISSLNIAIDYSKDENEIFLIKNVISTLGECAEEEMVK